MELAFGVIGITPSVFWSLTLREWSAMQSGFARKHGAGSVLTASDISEIQRMMADG